MMYTKKITKYFDMKDMSVTDVTLGIQISRIYDGIVLSQSHQVERVFKRFNLYEESPVKKSILILSLHLVQNKGKSVSQLKYSQVIENLMYIINYTRLDIAYTVNKRSRFIYFQAMILEGIEQGSQISKIHLKLWITFYKLSHCFGGIL